jgi:hypothetical protein
MISHEYKCIFIHIPKTAGTSIEHRLGHFQKLERGVQDHRTIREIEPLSTFEFMRMFLTQPLMPSRKTFVKQHIKNKLFRNRSVSPQQYNSYFKFTFVRNPWGRVFSWYKNVIRDDFHRKTKGVSDTCSFEEFISNHMNQWALRPQLFWIVENNGKIPLDFIGRFERLEIDFSHVCDILGIRDKTLPKMLVGDGQHYTKFYDDEMKEIVANKYAEEIDLFKFRFGE